MSLWDADDAAHSLSRGDSARPGPSGSATRRTEGREWKARSVHPERRWAQISEPTSRNHNEAVQEAYRIRQRIPLLSDATTSGST